jgi:hypothetical protein
MLISRLPNSRLSSLPSLRAPAQAFSAGRLFSTTSKRLSNFLAFQPLCFHENTNAHFTNSFSINKLQMPRGCAPLLLSVFSVPSVSSVPSVLKSSLLPATNSFRINTSKSVCKQRTLTIFRINTYKKLGEGSPSHAPRLNPPSARITSHSLFLISVLPYHFTSSPGEQ